MIIQPPHKVIDQYWNPPSEHDYKQSAIMRVSRIVDENDIIDSVNDYPSYIAYNKQGKVIIKRWHKNGFMHRLNGPAEIHYDNNNNVISQRYAVNGDDLTNAIASGVLSLNSDGTFSDTSVFALTMIGGNSWN